MADLPTLRAKVEAVQALAAKATPGPWERTGPSFGYTMVRPTSGRAAICGSPTGGSYDHAANADLLAAAPDLVTLAADLLALAESQAEALTAILRPSGLTWWCEPKPCGVVPTPDTVECRTCGSWSGPWSDRLAIQPECPACKATHDSVEAQLTAIRAALGNGADEAAWRPGETLAEAVGRLREVLLGCAYELGVKEYNDLHGAPKSDDDWGLSSQDAYASAFAQAYVNAEQKDNGGPNG